MRFSRSIWLCKALMIAIGIKCLWAVLAFSQSPDPLPVPPLPEKLTLVNATMCEDIQSFAPVGSSVVFSIKRGKVYCYSAFDPVPEKTFIYHSWFRREELITTIRLSLKPPRWSTFSNIQLREADKGPWRVEIYNRKGDNLETLRFSITD